MGSFAWRPAFPKALRGEETVNARNFFTELKRRNVYKVAVAYAVVGWLLIQVATQVFPFLEISNWAIRLVIFVTALGFPVALVIAWAFELTPEGLKRTEFADKLPKKSSRDRVWLYVVVLAGAISVSLFFLGRYTAPTKPSVSTNTATKSIVVLPFANLSEDKANAYFADGIQEEILTRLAKIADLKVISRTSTQRYQSNPGNLAEIAKQLDVANILEGSVQKAGDTVRVSVNLIQAASDSHLWAETYDRKLTDILGVESEIAKTIAEQLQAKLTRPEQNALAGRPTENTEAYQLYLRGRYFWNKRTAADFKRAIGYLNQAIEKDPNYALAYAGLADVYVLLSAFGEGSPKDTFPQAKAAAMKALELDESLGEAHATLGIALFGYDLNLAQARREFQRAIELNPNYATAHQWYAECGLAPFERFDEAIAEMKRALELDPLSIIINADFGSALGHARRLDEAIAQLRKTVEMDPNFYYARWQLGEVLEAKGFNEEAAAQYKKAIELNDDPLPRALLGHLYARTDRKDEARAILRELRELSKQRYVALYNLALIHIGLGEKAATTDLLEQAYEQHDGYNIAYINVDPCLDPLRGDPRFEALVQKIFGGK
jgi:TolB-like protein/Tfp pilus assembly protein PilF